MVKIGTRSQSPSWRFSAFFFSRRSAPSLFLPLFSSVFSRYLLRLLVPELDLTFFPPCVELEIVSVLQEQVTVMTSSAPVLLDSSQR